MSVLSQPYSTPAVFRKYNPRTERRLAPDTAVAVAVANPSRLEAPPIYPRSSARHLLPTTPMSVTPFFSSPLPFGSCKYHSAPDARCMGCRMAMGAPAESYFDYRDQKCYTPRSPPPPPPVPAPLSPTESAVSGESDEESYLLRMWTALQEMDKGVEFVAGERFLDLGCCPGGFSTYVLNKLPEARGDGVSLPVELGGHSLAMPADLHSRFQVHWGDMTRFNHALEHAGSGRFTERPKFPISPDSYDLVLADGHIPPELSRAPGISPFARDLLLVSQLLAGIRAVKKGGTILIKLSLSFANNTLDGLNHRLVLALSNLSDTPLLALKPKSIYAKQGSFYVLVRGVKPVPRRVLELALETMWVQLTEGKGVDNKALDRMVSSAETKSRQGWLRSFLEPVEEVRRSAKRNMA